MKKAAVICLLLLASLTAFASDWTIEHYHDDFGDEMEEFYITSGVENGTYSDDIDTDSPLAWKLLISENRVGFKLYKNGTQLFKNTSTYDGDFEIILRDDNGVDYDFSGYFNGSTVTVEWTEGTSLLRLLAINKNPRIVIYEYPSDTYRVRNTFKLGVVPNDGLTEFYKETYGVDWSLPLTIKLSDDVVYVPMYSDEISSIGVDVFLGTEKVYCDYQVNFAYDLTCTIGDDKGFLSYSYHHDFSSKGNWERDYNHIYLNHYTNLTNERSGYITVQLGEVTEKCLVNVVFLVPETVQVEPKAEAAPEQTVTKAPTSSSSSDISLVAGEEDDSFLLTEIYRNGKFLVYAELKNKSAEAKFNIADDKILEMITWLSENYPDYTVGVSYTLNDSVLNVSYPEIAEDEADNIWRLLKSALNTYCLTLEENTSEKVESEAAEIPAAEGIDELQVAEVSDEDKGEGATVNLPMPFKTGTIPNSVTKATLEKPFSMRARIELRGSIEYTGKTIEGTFQNKTKTGNNEKHGLGTVMIESRFFVTSDLYFSLSVGPCYYIYSFTERINTNNSKSESIYSAVIFGASAELGFGIQKDGIYGDIRLGVAKTFMPEYNENTNITFTGIFGLYVAEMGFGLDYNIEENKIRPQVVIALSIPLCHLENKNGEKHWKAFAW